MWGRNQEVGNANKTLSEKLHSVWKYSTCPNVSCFFQDFYALHKLIFEALNQMYTEAK